HRGVTIRRRAARANPKTIALPKAWATLANDSSCGAPALCVILGSSRLRLPRFRLPLNFARLPMPHIAVDFERLKMLHCGLGQLSLHLGRALAQEAPADIELTYFLPAERAALFAGTRVRCAPVREWHRERFVAPLRPLLARVCRGLPIDLWHATHQQTTYLPLDPRTPVLLTLHALNCLRDPSPAQPVPALRVL